MAAEVEENSIGPLESTGNRPLVVRIKRKAFHSPVEAFWLEINERPFKRPLIDFEKLSISESSGQEDLRTRRVFVKHVDTVSSSEATVEILKTCVKPCHDDGPRSRGNDGSQRQFAAMDNKQSQLLSKAKKEQETSAKNARFKQIWRKRMRNKEGSIDESLHQLCHLYDVVRVDAEETHQKEKQQEKMSKEDEEYLAKFLPMLREHIPDAAEQIESDISSSTTGQDGYVYDLYTIGEESTEESDDTRPYPLLIQVDDDDDDMWYDGPDDSDCESYDSNAEHHPLNDYPDEVSDDEEEKSSKSSSDDESEVEAETGSDKSSGEDRKKCELDLSEDEMHNGYSDDDVFDDDGEDDEDWSDNDDVF